MTSEYLGDYRDTWRQISLLGCFIGRPEDAQMHNNDWLLEKLGKYLKGYGLHYSPCSHSLVNVNFREHKTSLKASQEQTRDGGTTPKVCKRQRADALEMSNQHLDLVDCTPSAAIRFEVPA